VTETFVFCVMNTAACAVRFSVGHFEYLLGDRGGEHGKRRRIRATPLIIALLMITS
jgi:hypothetical protein